MNKLIWMAILAICSQPVVAQQPPTPPPVRTAPTLVTPWVLHSKLIQEVDPSYPEAARKYNLEGDVMIKVFVDENGNVTSARWILPSGASTILAFEALQAVKKWKYQPRVVDGTPVPMVSWIAIRFQLKKTPNIDVLTKSEISAPSIDPVQLRPKPIPSISSDVALGSLLNHVDPSYPLEAKVAHIQGDVVLFAVIGSDGNINQMEPISGNPVLVRASMAAVRLWRYKPYRVNGEPVDVDTTVTVKFHM